MWGGRTPGVGRASAWDPVLMRETLQLLILSSSSQIPGVRREGTPLHELGLHPQCHQSGDTPFSPVLCPTSVPGARWRALGPTLFTRGLKCTHAKRAKESGSSSAGNQCFSLGRVDSGG